jgi:uncharacterized protein (TIGR00369 family)
MDFEVIKASLSAAVPMVRTLNLEYLELDDERALLRMPDDQAFHNHIGGPHAGAMFTLGESASGAVVIAAFSDQMSRALPLAADGSIVYTRPAMGAVLAEARLSRPKAEVIAELDEGKNGRFAVNVELRTEDGTVTGQMTVTWVLRLNRV